MNTIQAVLAIVFALAFAQYSNAEGNGLFVEPAVTYERSTTATDFPSPLSSSTGTVEGLGLGVKVGLHISDIVFAGLDVRYGMPQYKDSSVTYDAKSVATNWGAVVGAQMPVVGLRLWGGIILGGELNPEASGSFDVAFKKATGYRLGAGFRVTAVSLNLEYQELQYGETLLEQFGPFSPGSTLSSVNPATKGWIASVSFPLEL